MAPTDPSPSSSHPSPLLFPSDVPSHPNPLTHLQSLRQGQPDPSSSTTITMSRARRPMHQSFLALCAEIGSTTAEEQEDFLAPQSRQSEAVKIPTSKQAPHNKRIPQDRQDMMRSLPALSRRTVQRQRRKQVSLDDAMTSSQILSPPRRPAELPPSTLSHESVTADMDAMGETTDPPHDGGEDTVPPQSPIEEQPESLPDVLMRIFDLPEREDVSQVYPCWIVRSSQSSMVNGHLYILQSLVCFYAYLPRRPHVVLKSGHLQKRGRQNPRFNKYWFVLKGNTLSYFTDKAQPYFPRNTVNLSSAISVQLINANKQEHSCDFSITTDKETYLFRTDTFDDAQHWVQQIERAMFRSRSDSDSIKYLIPIKDIASIEEEQILEGTTTIQVNVTHAERATDEYIFSFFGATIDVKERLLDLQSEFNSAGVGAVSPVLHALSQPMQSGQPSAAHLATFRLSSTPEASQLQHSEDSLRPNLATSDSSTSLYQKATGLAGYLRSQSKRVGTLLANESYNYYDKAHGMWVGGRTHYDEDDAAVSPRLPNELDDKALSEHNDRFRNHFSLPNSERLQATYYCYLSRTVPRYGKIYMGITRICYRSLLPPFRTKMILPYKAIESVTQKQSHLSSTYGLVLSIRGQEELFFEFREQDSRDDCAVFLHKQIEAVRNLEQSSLVNPHERARVEAAKAEHDLLNKLRRNSLENEVILPDQAELDFGESPLIYDDFGASSAQGQVKNPGLLRIKCLTIGSRGDVQPFIALCKGLKAEGHIVTIATHAEFGDWIKSHGIGFAPIAGDPAQLMRLCVEHDMFTPGFVREAWFGFRNMVSDILTSAWESCQDCDLLIEAPNAMAGIHIAEALQIPLFRAFTMPWTKTRAHPHAFLVPRTKRGGLYNLGSHVLFQQAYWQGISGLVNSWRKEQLGLPPTSLALMQQDRVPFMYNFSQLVVSTPLDWDPWIKITGYWFLDEGGSAYQPPAPLVEFIDAAQRDKKKIVYIGFGSIVIDDAPAFSRKIVQAVQKADVRCVLSKGWSNRLELDPAQADVSLPDTIFSIDKAPHDWLFAQMDAAVHHGGAGTTGASIRAGIPTIAKPFFGDQWFFGQRIEDLGVGVCLHKIEVDDLAAALTEVTTSARIMARAKELGEKVRSEDGIQTAIHNIYRNLDYARSLVKERPTSASEAVEGLEEGWTMIDDDYEYYDLEARSPEVEGPAFTSSLGHRKPLGLEGGLEMPAGYEDEGA